MNEWIWSIGGIVLIEETWSTPRKLRDNANLLTVNPTRIDLDLDTCRYVVFINFFTVIKFDELQKLRFCFFKQLKFISYLFHIFCLGYQTVILVPQITLTEATSIGTIKYYVNYSSSGLQNLRIFKCLVLLKRNIYVILLSPRNMHINWTAPEEVTAVLTFIHNTPLTSCCKCALREIDSNSAEGNVSVSGNGSTADWIYCFMSCLTIWNLLQAPLG